MTTSRQGSEFEAEIETMLETVFRIIHEGVILHEYLSDKEYATLSVTLKNINPPLRGLRISQCLKEPLTTYALTQLLQGNLTLEWFHLEANHIDATGIKAIAEILKQNSKLQQLYCGFILNGLTVEDIQAIADMLLTNKTLKDLTLYANAIDSEKTKILADALSKNPALEKLNLASNEIGKEGAIAIADALTKNTNLQELNVSDCRLGKEGILAIISALKQNKGLQTLTLRYLNAEYIPALSEMLVENSTLKNLDLSLYSSEFTVEEMEMLLQALRKNKSLQKLGIQDNDGKLKDEISEIKQILMKNVTPLAPAEPAAAEAAAGDAKPAQPEAKAGEEKKATAEKPA